ncbi:hypothetical protein MJT46_005133 [Ovis ammon polii x Ovis aries]|nr:hypothetical protein MJT46_005133 [Ovis ammon polii x Ovis aries]
MTAKLKKQFCEKARVLRQTQITRWKCIRNVTASPNAKDEEKGTLLKSIYELPEVGDITLFTRSVLLKSTKTTVHMAHKYFKHLLFTELKGKTKEQHSPERVVRQGERSASCPFQPAESIIVSPAGMYPFNTSKTLDPSPEDPTSESSPDQASLKDESMGF